MWANIYIVGTYFRDGFFVFLFMQNDVLYSQNKNSNSLAQFIHGRFFMHSFKLVMLDILLFRLGANTQFHIHSCKLKTLYLNIYTDFMLAIMVRTHHFKFQLKSD